MNTINDIYGGMECHARALWFINNGYKVIHHSPNANLYTTVQGKYGTTIAIHNTTGNTRYL
jgi:hypothetical protein